jgi:hypothetical protein
MLRAWIWMIFWVAPLSVTPGLAQSLYTTWDGERLSVVRGDPRFADGVLEWQIWLYRLGQAQEPKRNWGTISGTAAAAVMEELRRVAEQDHEATARCRCPASELTYDNYLGPIAVVRRPRGMSQRLLERIQGVNDLQGKVAEMRRLYDISKGYAEVRDRQFMPRGQVGAVLMQYAMAVQRATRKVIEARQLVEHIQSQGMGEFAEALRLMQADFDQAAALTRTLDNMNRQGRARALANRPVSPQARPSPPSGGVGFPTSYRYEDMYGRISQSLTVGGGQIQVQEARDGESPSIITVEFARIGDLSVAPFGDHWMTQVICPDWRDKNGYYRSEGSQSSSECIVSVVFPTKRDAEALYRFLKARSPARAP